jgi:DNA-binding MurR/RpiR family transcriptional regulator
MTSISNPLSERITQHYAQLTENNRRLADYLQLHPDKILILSTNEIAEACSVSKTSVSRFIRKLGYDDHTALRNELLAVRDKGEPLLTTPIHDSELQQELRAMKQLWAQLGEVDVDALVEKLATAKRIKVIGYRNSYPLALHLRHQLLQCRQNVDLIPQPGQTIGEELASITPDDFVVVFGFRRRVANFAQIIEQLSKHQSLLITDQSGQQYVQSVSHYLICYMNNDSPLDSYAVPMSLISHLVNKTYRFLAVSAVKTTAAVSSNYKMLHELE